MFEMAIQELGDTTVYQLVGRITFETAGSLRAIILHKQRNRVAVLDLAETTAIDAAGVGSLISLRQWAKESGTTLKLMNLTPRAENLLELTHLRGVFQVCTAQETFELMCRAMHYSPAVEKTQGLEFALAG